MSGIYIPGAEMPYDCPVCPLSHWNAEGNFTGCEIKKRFFSPAEMLESGRPSFCPLISVPPHGRLIDADALDGAMWKMRAQYQMLDDTQVADKIMHGLYRAEQTIKDAPTIIPADPAEEGE